MTLVIMMIWTWKTKLLLPLWRSTTRGAVKTKQRSHRRNGGVVIGGNNCWNWRACSSRVDWTQPLRGGIFNDLERGRRSMVRMVYIFNELESFG